jgi:cobalt-zinc-cadmium efflux system protein
MSAAKTPVAPDPHSHLSARPEGNGGGNRTAGRRLKLAFWITAAIFVAEVIGGVLTSSLALLSDAGHVFADLFALGISAFAFDLARKPPDRHRTFGYHRAEVFAALVNGLGLVGISVWIVIEAIKRLGAPVPVDSGPMAIVAAVGLAANLTIVFLLRGHCGQNLNVRSAFLHVIGDLLASVAVLAGGLVMLATGWYLIDPLLSLLVVAIILRGAIHILREAIHILLEGIPRGIELAEVEQAIQEVDGVRGVHDLHIWSLCSEYLAASAHVLVAEQSTSDARQIVEEVARMLGERFRIVHSTIQPESESCSPVGTVVCSQEHPH